MSGEQDDLYALARRLAELDNRYRQAVHAGAGPDAAQRTLASMLSSGDVDIGWLATHEPGRGLSISAVLGASTDRLEKLAIREGAGLTGKVFLTGRPELIDGYLTSKQITHEFDDIISGEGVVRLLAVPIVRDGRVTGVLTAGCRSDGVVGDRTLELALSAAHSLVLAEEVAERERFAREAAAEQVRRRLALDLHASLGAVLYSIGVDARGLREAVGADPSLLGRLDRLTERTSEAVTLLREALRTLHASPTELSLGARMQADCKAFAARTGIRSQVMVLSQLPPISDQVFGELLRAFREALRNVEKHAMARTVVVTASAERGRLTLVVSDDGCGLRNDAEPSGPGIDASRAAVERLGGTLTLRDGADGGAVWRLVVPVERSAAEQA